MTLDNYFGLGKPDDKKTTTHRTDSLHLITSAFEVWHSWLRNATPPCIPTKIQLKEIAEETDNFVASCVSYETPVIEGGEYFAVVSQMDINYKQYAGLFYTALLNTKTDRMIVPNIGNLGCYWGYRMKKGLLDITAGTAWLGEDALGGCIINRGFAFGSLGENAVGGLFVNLGTTYHLGPKAQGGIFINHGRCDDIGMHASHGFFANYQPVNSVGYEGEGIFISPVKPYADEYSQRLRLDEHLLSLINELERASNDYVDIKTIERIVACVSLYS